MKPKKAYKTKIINIPLKGITIQKYLLRNDLKGREKRDLKCGSEREQKKLKKREGSKREKKDSEAFGVRRSQKKKTPAFLFLRCPH